MDRYFLRVDPEKNETKHPTILGAVSHAFETEEPLVVSGCREGVNVELELQVLRLARLREVGDIILSFSGVVKPENNLFYLAHVVEDKDSPTARISIETHPIIKSS